MGCFEGCSEGDFQAESYSHQILDLVHVSELRCLTVVNSRIGSEGRDKQRGRRQSGESIILIADYGDPRQRPSSR